MRPVLIPSYIKKIIYGNQNKVEMCNAAKENYKSLCNGVPDASVVMPAYNETENIVLALYSLCANKTNLNVEIIVSNNNSKDDTAALAKACGVQVVNEINQGITFARNCGLNFAKGKYILNADADTIYPEDWIDLMLKPLIENEDVAITYGRFSLIPVGSTGRIPYFFYEQVAQLSRWYNKKFREEAVNVYGFNSAFRKEQGLLVDGFKHPEGTNEDGWLAVKLRKKGFGRLFYVNNIKALAWTTDRRILMDGGILKGSIKRMKRVLGFR